MTVFRFGFPALAALALTVGAPALAKPTLEDYSALPVVQMMSVSPDGTMVAFLRRLAEREFVLVYSLAQGEIISGVDVSELRPSQLYFLNDSRVILVASDEKRRGGYGYRRWFSTASSLNIADGRVTRLLQPGDTISPYHKMALGRILGVSADGKHVYMPAFMTRPHLSSSFGLALMEVDLESVRRPDVVMWGNPSTVDYFLDANGNVLAEEILGIHDHVQSILSYHDGKALEIYRAETELPLIDVSALTSDRKSLIFQDESDATDRTSYYSMALADGAVSGPIFEREDADVEAILVDVNRIAWGVVYSGLKPSYEFFDETLTRRVAVIQEHFAGNSVRVTNASPDLRHLIIRVEGSNTSGDYYLLSDDDKLVFLASTRPEIAPEDVNPVIAYEYLARDDAIIPSLVTLPLEHADNPEMLPAVMLPRGGPESHDWVGFDWLAQALASEGYAVIQPQFRGSSGFGLKHLLAGRVEGGKKSREDITDALRNLIEERLVDPERVCIVGAGYGGFAALAGGAFTPELYRCVVSINGVSDVRTLPAQDESEHGRSSWAVAYWNDVIARGDTSKETLDSISPASLAEKFTAPVLLLHGDKDKVVAFDQSRHMEKQLKRADKAVELVKLKGEDHYLSSPETRLEALKETVAFVNAHIGSTT